MKAIVCTKYGEPEVLQMKEVEKPVPGNNEVLIKIHATTVATSECNIRNLTFVPKLFHLPMLGKVHSPFVKGRLQIKELIVTRLNPWRF